MGQFELNDPRIPEIGKKIIEVVCGEKNCGGKIFQPIQLTTLFIELNVRGEGSVKGVPQPGPYVCIKCGKDYIPEVIVRETLEKAAAAEKNNGQAPN